MFFTLSLISVLAAAAHSQSLRGIVPKVPYPKNILEGDTVNCESWKFAVETNNIRSWTTIPTSCLKYVQDYMNGPRYAADCNAVAGYAIEYAQNVSISHGSRAGKDAWIFDVDETLLSNLPYYKTVGGYGSKVFNETSFNEWVAKAAAPAIPSSLKFYRQLLEDQRSSTEKNLKAAGFGFWEMLILRGSDDEGKTAELYKSERRAWLESSGYKIHGNSGDQWSDLACTPLATRSFKLPNPMYYVA
ncbi:unnamed protein product [Spirodela intermedia]|uniref:Uncharacterized protein n=1 Tax=Spirodela intermedia TaxID=51605 RepID=A0A7I8J7Q1_SPIIN|nr:unnamed protein product [Spirodela intermedia]CAA6666070.1 unnamed protein product [Spirodela intermedia]